MHSKETRSDKSTAHSSFFRGAAAAGAGVGTLPGSAAFAQVLKMTQGDVDILRFLATAENLETYLRDQTGSWPRLFTFLFFCLRSRGSLAQITEK